MQLHHTRASEEFKLVVKLCTAKLHEDKQNAHAAWITKVYLAEP